jgi:hypothetical protein
MPHLPGHRKHRGVNQGILETPPLPSVYRQKVPALRGGLIPVEDKGLLATDWEFEDEAKELSPAQKKHYGAGKVETRTGSQYARDITPKKKEERPVPTKGLPYLSPWEEQRTRVLREGKLGLTGDEWIEHMRVSKSLNLPYDAPYEDRVKASENKVRDLIARVQQKQDRELSYWELFQMFLGGWVHNRGQSRGETDLGDLFLDEPNRADFEGITNVLTGYMPWE